MRALASWRHMWAEFVVSSCLAPSVFLQVLQFSSLHKKENQHRQLQIGFLSIYSSCNCKFYLFEGATLNYIYMQAIT